MANINAATAVAKVLKEEGVEWYAGVHGGHIWQLMAEIGKTGIRMYHMRHEQSGVYCAEGWARTTGKPGVCFGTAGPGYGNMVSGMYQAHLSRSPVICLLGQHSTAGRLKLDELITNHYPLEKINEAIESVERGEALRNVIMFPS